MRTPNRDEAPRIAAWALGLVLVWQGGWWSSGWLWARLALVLGLSGLHGLLARQVKEPVSCRRWRRFGLEPRCGIVGSGSRLGTGA